MSETREMFNVTAEEAIAEFWRQFRAAMAISPESWEWSLNEQTDEQNAAFSRALSVLAPWDSLGEPAPEA